MQNTQLIILLVTLAVFIGLGFAMSRSIKKHDAKQKASPKKNTKKRYIPEYKNPGK